jgi:hypothetical protein
MGKVKEAACAWPNVSPESPPSSLSTQTFNNSTTRTNTNDEYVLKELEQELFRLNAQIANGEMESPVSQYLSMLEEEKNRIDE